MSKDYFRIWVDHLDRFNEYIGRGIRWTALLMVLVVCVDVTFRYLLKEGSALFPELEWHLFSLMFLLGSGYALRHDKHVRVDVIYARLSGKQKAWLNLLGHLLLLLPFCFVLFYASEPFVYRAFVMQEQSPDPGGLPYRFIIKSAIPAAAVLLGLQGIVEIAKCVYVIRYGSYSAKHSND
ncbi:MAG: C4-dicarboxylate ABC transporter substrate-binding protein [Thermonema sp.]|uniref:TRAP transporter small permease subunit n=1 Tax=Thermonema TaxID=28194 RepID=UPI00056DEE63|nr:MULTISPECIES: TRAP transporter small permease subunit [Thermonema]GIV38290.1 MAG: C4-dicarboxylate ABC transporter substrate-binding protein [Thermonema sp.]